MRTLAQPQSQSSGTRIFQDPHWFQSLFEIRKLVRKVRLMCGVGQKVTPAMTPASSLNFLDPLLMGRTVNLTQRLESFYLVSFDGLQSLQECREHLSFIRCRDHKMDSRLQQTPIWSHQPPGWFDEGTGHCNAHNITQRLSIGRNL